MAHSKPLTQTRIEALKPRDRPYKVVNDGGLPILATPGGGKLWRLAYRHASGKGLSKTLPLGAYVRDANGLTQVRAAREAAKLALKAGRDAAHTPPDLTG
jgi:hypothetical protein